MRELLDDLVGADSSGEQRVWAMRCAHALGLDGLGVSLRWGDELVWFSDEISLRLADAQFALGQGPGLWPDFETASFITVEMDGPGTSWPQFAAEARELGVRVVCAWAVRTGAAWIGTLTGYRNTPGPLSDRQITDGLLVADVMCGRLLAWHPGADGSQDGPRTAGVVDLHRVEVHQATGVLSHRLDIPIDEALARLRARAFAESRPITEVAREVLHRHLPG
ncbi:ANTAR domain-containing protein [Streptomyces sp. NPDC048172]|uniref:ANTAR domain-containing protein n=1 Tax=Streptomyces sp. NPDC048172 TaxID=3365505 RepID=UPI003715260C